MSEMLNDVEDDMKIRPVKAVRAKQTLSWVALFLGELRDGLTMINMQSAFLITSKYYTEKQAGIMFFIFGMSQFLFQTPAGYLMDYTDKKVLLLGTASVTTTLLTLITATFAQEYGQNLTFMVFIKFLQGGITALIPPGLNSIAQGIVGSEGMTEQVSKNEMMNHLGTAIIVLSGSLLAFFLYPNIGLLFIVSPLACIGVIFFLCRIRPGDIDHNAARGLKTTSKTTDKLESFDGSYLAPPNNSNNNNSSPSASNNRTSPTKSPTLGVGGTASNTSSPSSVGNIYDTPSFNFGLNTSSPNKDYDSNNSQQHHPQANTPLQILQDPILLLFIIICFCFHMANGTVLPLVMQTLAIANGRMGILMSGMCIIVAQTFMVLSAKICGDYSVTYGRKSLFLIGLFSVPIRCAILTCLLHIKEAIAAGGGGGGGSSTVLDIFILSTQILDGVGAGIFGTMYVLVTSDISGGTGRFSLTLGLTTAAMSIGGTVSGYLGQALAQDIGYRQAFVILGFMALIPALLYLGFMPETLPEMTINATSNIGGRIGNHNHNMESGGGGDQNGVLSGNMVVVPMVKIEEGEDESSTSTNRGNSQGSSRGSGGNEVVEPTTKYNELL